MQPLPRGMQCASARRELRYRATLQRPTPRARPRALTGRCVERCSRLKGLVLRLFAISCFHAAFARTSSLKRFFSALERCKGFRASYTPGRGVALQPAAARQIAVRSRITPQACRIDSPVRAHSCRSAGRRGRDGFRHHQRGVDELRLPVFRWLCLFLCVLRARRPPPRHPSLPVSPPD